jgi:hypothetical protein
MACRLFAATALAMLATAGVAQTPAPSSPGPLKRDEIVVIGAKLSDLKAEVERCEAGGCTVREDVIATVRYAEAEFREGNYRDARKALGRAVSRTRKHADSDPFAVAELHTARATVAWHFGDQREALRATGATTRLLNRHAPQSTNALMAQMRLMQAQYQFDAPSVNIRELENLSERATAANQPQIAMRADLGRAAMLYRTNRRAQAMALLEAIQASDAPQTDRLKLAAEVLAMRLAASDGDMAAVEGLIARLTEDQKKLGPTLIWAPPTPTPYGPGNMPPIERDSPLAEPQPGYFPFFWVDIGFAIGADGRVESAEILRGSELTYWAKPLVKAIAQRRYSPAAEPDDLAGRYRVERYTLTADFGTPKGSLIRRRAGLKRFEQMDLTVAPPKPRSAPTVPS